MEESSNKKNIQFKLPIETLDLKRIGFIILGLSLFFLALPG